MRMRRALMLSMLKCDNPHINFINKHSLLQLAPLAVSILVCRGLAPLTYMQHWYILLVKSTSSRSCVRWEGEACIYAGPRLQAGVCCIRTPIIVRINKLSRLKQIHRYCLVFPSFPLFCCVPCVQNNEEVRELFTATFRIVHN